MRSCSPRGSAVGPSSSLLLKTGCSLLQPRISRLGSHCRLCRSPQQKHKPGARCRAPRQHCWQRELAGQLASSGQSKPRHFGVRSESQQGCRRQETGSRAERAASPHLRVSVPQLRAHPPPAAAHPFRWAISLSGELTVQPRVPGSTCNLGLQNGDPQVL